jgi:hypothetical protein
MAADSYQAPDYDITRSGTRDSDVLQWCEARLIAGRAFVESSAGYDRIEAANDAIFANEKSSGSNYAPVPARLSKTRANLTAKTAEDLVAMLTDTRLFWHYTTYNPAYEPQARLLNKQAAHWYTSNNIDLRVGDGIRYYTTSGSAILHMYYSKRLNDLMVEAKDPRQVYPINPVDYYTFQTAEGVIIRDARTPTWVENEYGKKVPPDEGSAGIFGWLKRTMTNVGNAVKHSGPLSRNKGADQAIPATPTVFVNTMFLDDRRTNNTDKPVYMGEWDMETDPANPKPLTNWSYRVDPGKPLFPFKRMIVWTKTTLLYDNTSPYWHGKYPLLKLTLNPWPKSWLGKAPLWDVMPLNESYNSSLRVVDDHAGQVAQPGTVADKNVSRAELNKFNSRLSGWKIKTNLAAGKGIQIVNPPPLDNSIWQHLSLVRELIRDLGGTADLSQISQLNQIPSDDTIDSMMKAMTPGVRLRSRILEGFMKEFAEMYLWTATQFDTVSKRIATFGPNAITKEDFDSIGGNFIPDMIPDGTPGDIGSTAEGLALGSSASAYERAKLMLSSFAFGFKPASLLNSAATQERMEDFLLAKMGYLSVFTLWENLGRDNFLPADKQMPNSELERLQLQAQLGVGMIANSQGRKATDQAPPSMGTNANGPTIQTS